MKTIALASVRGAPGVTTSALLLASRLGGSALVEADLSGGVLAVRYGLGREPGLTSLAPANPTEAGGWLEHAQDAGGGRECGSAPFGGKVCPCVCASVVAGTLKKNTRPP